MQAKANQSPKPIGAEANQAEPKLEAERLEAGGLLRCTA